MLIRCLSEVGGHTVLSKGVLEKLKKRYLAYVVDTDCHQNISGIIKPRVTTQLLCRLVPDQFRYSFPYPYMWARIMVGFVAFAS